MVGVASGTRARVLAELRAADVPVMIGELAERMAVHPNTVRFHLRTLVDRGQAEYVAVDPQGQGRPPLRVRATTVMDPDGPREYRALAQALLGAFRASPDGAEQARRAGRQWGAGLIGTSLVGASLVASDRAAAPTAPAGAADDARILTELLGELGFEPKNSGGGEITLHRCPFLELAEEGDRIVCEVHLGIMQGAMGAVGAATEVASLEPFVRPDCCLVRLRSQDAAA